jgi:hypothetical protein
MMISATFLMSKDAPGNISNSESYSLNITELNVEDDGLYIRARSHAFPPDTLSTKNNFHHSIDAEYNSEVEIKINKQLSKLITAT